ncbi:MAG TPA: hypothetical protein DEF34_11150 [Desulfotomaculum sp.]|nr:hypothetical protein [Desulfotomaculum sp.]
MVKKFMVAVLVTMFCLMAAVAAPAPAAAETVADALDGLVEYYEDNKPELDNWEEIVGLGRAGVIDRFDLSEWQVELDGSATSYAATILALDAAGEDPQNYIDQEGNVIKLVDQLEAKQQPDGGFGGSINNTAYAVLALEKVGGSYRAKDAFDYIVRQQKSDGGFSISGTSGDPDTTGLTMMALADLTVDESVYGSVYGVDYLRDAQLPSGGYASFGSENTESIAFVIRGLLACGEDITTWNKGDNNIVHAMFNFRLADGSFAHYSGGPSDDIATRQALMALADLKKSHASFIVGEGGSGGGDPGVSGIKVRVEGARDTLASGEVEVDGTALDALKALVGESSVLFNSWGMVSSILGESENRGASMYWLYYVVRDGEVDPVSLNTGSGGYNVVPGDEVVFYIGAYDSDGNDKTFIPVIDISPSNPTVGQTLTINVNGMYFDWDEKDFGTASVDPVTIDFNGEQYETYYGQVQIPLAAAGTFQLSIHKQHPDGYPELVRSSRQITVGEAVNKQVKVRVEGTAGRLASGTVEVGGTALDALKALVNDDISESGGFINSIKGEGSAVVNSAGSTYWLYYVLSDGVIDDHSLNVGSGGYNVKSGDEAVFYNGLWSDTLLTVLNMQPVNPKAGNQVTIKVKTILNGSLIEQAVSDIKLVINGQEQRVTSGQPISFTAAEGSLNIRAEKYDPLGYPNIVPAEVSLDVTPQGSSGGNGGDTITVNVLVRGENREQLYSGAVEITDNEDRNPMYALKQTPLSVVTRYNDRYVYSIEGITEDSSSTAGWKYKVNGVAPATLSAKDYRLEGGDEVEWFWALDADDTGSGAQGSVVPQELEADEQTRELVAEELSKLLELLPGLAPVLEELFNRVELAAYNVVVLDSDHPMTDDDRAKWQEWLEQNRVRVSRSVDPAGDSEITDTQSNDNEISLSLPGGSLDSQTTIEIYELTGTDDTIPASHRQVSSVYDFGPDGLTFNNPVILRIKIAGFAGAWENLILAWYDAANDCWVPVPSVIDPANGEISGLVTHFTKFTVLAREKQPISFANVGNGSYDWARQEIQYLAFKGIISDTGAGNFEPQRPVTRGEFVIMLAKAMGIEAVPGGGGQPSFTDLQPDNEDYDIMQAAYAAGLVRGYEDGTLRADGQITREQIAALVTRALDLKPVATEPAFADREQVSAWAKESVIAVEESGLLRGFPDGSFKPAMLTDRAQSAVLIYRILSLK